MVNGHLYHLARSSILSASQNLPAWIATILRPPGGVSHPTWTRARPNTARLLLLLCDRPTDSTAGEGSQDADDRAPDLHGQL